MLSREDREEIQRLLQRMFLLQHDAYKKLGEWVAAAEANPTPEKQDVELNWPEHNVHVEKNERVTKSMTQYTYEQELAAARREGAEYMKQKCIRACRRYTHPCDIEAEIETFAIDNDGKSRLVPERAKASETEKAKLLEQIKLTKLSGNMLHVPKTFELIDRLAELAGIKGE